jgi:hypothetical protein
MTREEFAGAFQRELQRQGSPLGAEEAQAVVEHAWPVIAADPDPVRWARAFPHVEGGRIVCGPAAADLQALGAAVQSSLHKDFYDLVKAIEANPAFYGHRVLFNIAHRVMALWGEEALASHLRAILTAARCGREVAEADLVRCCEAVKRDDAAAFEQLFGSLS